MRYDSEHKQKTRERIVAEAARAMRDAGPAQVGVAAVMSAAGLTHGGFYAHFANKDALVAAAIARMFEESLRWWARSRQGREPGAALAHYIDRYLSPEHRAAPGRGCPLAALAGEPPRLAPPARLAFHTGSQSLQAALAEALAELGRDDPAGQARALLAELVGQLTLARAEPDDAQAARSLARARQFLKQRLGLPGEMQT
ncbi:TetR/AcrR family transcriptional regulator [Bordetella hinzii]|uniref:TetR/AcrR family transcriptional regulator n=1 Tax=Bordetella hinzii TaxID=103855 RepID=UPI001C01D1A0|nr:TetR/AcrR family transcriptional regulator [Bordetella hinzii]QWF39094.1 TetR/AcrR family transcriptional regulator [Bordetella hinzii]